MRTVLIGSDFMYDKDGNLKPIELNTAVGWHRNKLENDSDIIDLSELEPIISANNITKIVYIGGLYILDKKFKEFISGSSITYEFYFVDADGITIPYVEDNEQTLIIRSAYDTTAVVDDTYCRDKVNFMNLIKDTSFGSQFAYIDDNGDLINNITTINDNGEHPNFLLKYITPSYDKYVYPKLYKVSNQEELNTILNNIDSNTFLMEYHFSSENLYLNHIQVKRELSILFPPDLESISIGNYTTFCNDDVQQPNVYDSDTFELISSRQSYITTDQGIGLPKLLDGDLVIMEDGTTKLAQELEVGDYVRTIEIPNPNNVDESDENVDYGITFDTLQSGSTYSSNKIIQIKHCSVISTITKLNFTDGTSWFDTEGSKYLSIRNNSVKFLGLENIPNSEYTLQIGDVVILMDSSDETSPTFVQKIIESIETTKEFFDGYVIEVERDHMFLTKSSTDSTTSYVAIEHNVACPSYSCTGNTVNCGKNFCCRPGGAAYWYCVSNCSNCYLN
jgi:hypothetical protein